MELFFAPGALILAFFIYLSLYNSLIGAKQKAEEGWSGIDVQLKRRYDLIPNLITTVKEYAKHEQELFEKITKTRAEALSTSKGELSHKTRVEDTLSKELKSIFALSEGYPELKANQNFLKLQEELTETEDQIASARRIYNANVNTYNTKVQTFPSSILASIHHFSMLQYFALDSSK